MSAPACATPLDDVSLLAYWLGETADAETLAIDEHLLGCAVCTTRLAGLLALAEGVRELFRRGESASFLSDGFVARLAAEGWRIREYRVPCNGSVLCSVAVQDDLLIGRLQAPLAGVARVDMVVHLPGRAPQRVEDVPFDAAREEVIVAPNLAQLRELPSHVQRLELIAVEAGGERRLGEYTFDHRAF